MIVVSDTNAVRTLLKAGMEGLLFELFGGVTIPQARKGFEIRVFGVYSAKDSDPCVRGARVPPPGNALQISPRSEDKSAKPSVQHRGGKCKRAGSAPQFQEWQSACFSPV